MAKPLGHGPEPRLGTAERAVLCQLVAADNHATLAEYGARPAAQTGVRVSRPVLCVTLKRPGLTRKKRRSGRASRRVPMSPPNAPPLLRQSKARTRDPGLSRRDRDQHQVDAALCARPARPARLWHRTRSLAPSHRARRAGAERRGLRHDHPRCHRLAGVQAFLQQILIPCLRQHTPGATVVMDHLAAHRLRPARAVGPSTG